MSRKEMSKFFVKENAGKSYEKLSPDGKYRLVVTSYSTAKGCWNYTQGLVYRVGEDKPLFEVQRNYSDFWCGWVNHPNGKAYLVCGEDYQGQTVLELDTGRRRDFLPTEAAKGCGFCWVDCEFDAGTQILTVSGCVWAAPFEYRFYDFSNPMEGWPELQPIDAEGKDTYIDADRKHPTFEPEGTIKTYQTKIDDDDEDEDDTKIGELQTVCTWRREGAKLVLVNEWVSDAEQTDRTERKIAHERYVRELAEFRANDPLYLAYLELIKDPALSPDKYEGHGVTYNGWCPGFEDRESRWCRRIIHQVSAARWYRREKKLTIDLEWGAKTGPIKLVIYKNGNHIEDKFFMEHSVKSMQAAFAHAKSMLTSC